MLVRILLLFVVSSLAACATKSGDYLISSSKQDELNSSLFVADQSISCEDAYRLSWETEDPFIKISAQARAIECGEEKRQSEDNRRQGVAIALPEWDKIVWGFLRQGLLNDIREECAKGSVYATAVVIGATGGAAAAAAPLLAELTFAASCEAWVSAIETKRPSIYLFPM